MSNIAPFTAVVPAPRLWRAARTVLRLSAGLTLALLGLLLLAWLSLHWAILPHIERLRPLIETQASQALGLPVRIGSIEARSSGWAPTFELRDVTLLDAEQRPALQLSRVLASISARSMLASAGSLELRLAQLLIDGARLEVRRDAAGRVFVAGIDFSSASASRDSRRGRLALQAGRGRPARRLAALERRTARRATRRTRLCRPGRAQHLAQPSPAAGRDTASRLGRALQPARRVHAAAARARRRLAALVGSGLRRRSPRRREPAGPVPRPAVRLEPWRRRRARVARGARGPGRRRHARPRTARGCAEARRWPRTAAHRAVAGAPGGTASRSRRQPVAAPTRVSHRRRRALARRASSSSRGRRATRRDRGTAAS